MLASSQYCLAINGSQLSSDDWEGFEPADAPEYGAHSNGNKHWTSTPRDKNQRRITISGIVIGSDTFATIKSMIGKGGSNISFTRIFNSDDLPLQFKYSTIVVQDFKYSGFSSKDGDRNEILCSVDIDVLDYNTNNQK